MLTLFILLIIFSLIWYLVTTYIPLPEPVKVIVNILAILFLCLILLNFAGLIGEPGYGYWKWR